MKHIPELYEGTEKYVFISYCHRDKDKVFPIIEELVEAGYRVWYDQGIHPGSEWPEIVAQHLNDSYIFMAFVSENYIQSQNCIREIHFAVAKQKELLSVILEPVELTPGVEMQLCASQALKKYEYKEETLFYKQLFSSVILEECHGEISVSEPETEAVKAKPERQKIRKEKSVKKGKGKKIVFAAVLLIVVLVVGKMVYQKVNTVELAGVEHNRKDSDFEFEDQTVTVEMISKLQEFENARTLRFQNCEFKKGALKELGKLDGLSFLEFENCKGIKNLNLLNSMPDLYKLSVVNCGLNDDSFQLSKTMEHLNELVVTNNPELTKCDWLSYMPKLYSLSLSYNGITDMAPIADLEELGILEMTDNKLQDASAQMKSLRLTKVNLSNNQIADFNGLSDLTILKRVYLGGNHYVEEEGTSLEFLKKSAAELVVADLSGNDFSPETFGYLADCVNLEELYIDGNQRVGSLEFLQNSATLQIFMASGCGISSLRGLEENKELRKIDLSNNQLETLAYFPQLETEMSVNLFLEGNKLKDISALPKGATYSVLLLYGNELDADAVNILTERKGSQIGMTYVEGMVPNVIAGFNLAYVENVPADKRVAWEDAHRGCEFGVLDKEGNVEEQ